MVSFSSIVVTVLTVSANAVPLIPRGTVSSSSIIGFQETVPAGTLGALYLKYKPFLNVVNGCVPFPAVDSAGNTNAGLNPTGTPSGDCSSSVGQVYARSGTSGGKFAIMYSWYWPKDSPSSGLGHRHDWESIVVWLSAQSTFASILGVAASAHGGYATTTSPNLSGTSPVIRYFSTWPLDHQLGFTSTKGGQQPLIAYESLPAVAIQALANTDFGDANVPFKDANFANNLAEAAL